MLNVDTIVMAGILLTLYTSYIYLPEYVSYWLWVMTDYFPATELYFSRDYLDQMKHRFALS
jgi:hypothetical protein